MNKVTPIRQEDKIWLHQQELFEAHKQKQTSYIQENYF